MLVVDDLVGWLIGQLADAGYRKLTTMVRGSDQERALNRAVAAAVLATADEISPSGKKQAGQVAKRISGAFGKPTSTTLPPRKLTRLEGIYAGIAQQLSVLDDGEQPPVGLLGMPISVVAARLGDHLIDEIMNRGAEGGPLASLADQLNHDLTHLQGQRIEGMLAQLLGEVRDALAAPGSAAGPVGWPLANVGDPFALEVHRPVEPDVLQPGLPVLPVYVLREHDTTLAEVVTAAVAGTSGIAVLVGGSSTGKTRACWEALERLRGVEPGWWLWHPIDTQAALAGLPGIGPRTVVWLNEAQRYLDPSDGAGERVAAGLRERLRDRARGPVLVLATLWPEFWAQLTARPQGADPHAQARELLVGHNIRVPDAFTHEELRELAAAGDPRLAQAAAWSRDGQVVQYLAGAPELLDRYHNAPPAARALIHAAMDARRLGVHAALPRAFLEAAAPGYLTDTEWDLLPGDWLEQALGYTATPSKGVCGPLAPIRPRPAPGIQPSPGDESAYQLADYLDQHSRRARSELIPPGAFWAAAASYAEPAALDSLAEAAEDRGLSRDAARLYKQASAHGHARAGARLVRLLHTLHPGDQRPAAWVVGHASLDDSFAVDMLLRELRWAGATGQVAALLERDPAAHASLDDPGAAARLLDGLRGMRATGQVTPLASRAPANVSFVHPAAQAYLLGELEEVEEASDDVTVLASRAADVSIDDPFAVARLLNELRMVGDTGQVTALASRAADVSIDDPGGVAGLLYELWVAEATGQVAVLLERDPAAHASLDNPYPVARLLDALHVVGATGQVAVLLERDPAAHASLDDPLAVAILLGALGRAGATGQVTALLERDPAAHASLDNPYPVARLLDALRAAGNIGQVTALARRAAAHASLDNPYGVAELLDTLQAAGARTQAAELIERLPAAGLFQLFCRQEGHGEQFRFGRETDGCPAKRWTWTDLG